MKKNRKLKHKIKIALPKLEKEDEKILKEYEKLDNRTNLFLSMSLAIFSLQVTLLTNTIFNTYKTYLLEKQKFFAVYLIILYLLNIFLNFNSILNFRKSLKTSEITYSNKNKLNEFIYGRIEE